jgi:hypothetical protein
MRLPLKTIAVALLAVLAASGCKKSGSKANVADAKEMLTAFTRPAADRPALFAALHPKPEDYDAVFVGDAAQAAKNVMEPLWDSAKGFDPADDQTEVDVSAATPDELAKGEGGAEDCPPQYKNIANKLNPKIVIYCFHFSRKGEKGGLAGDALVKFDDRWAYFPKPFRYLGAGAGSAGSAAPAPAPAPTASSSAAP